MSFHQNFKSFNKLSFYLISLLSFTACGTLFNRLECAPCAQNGCDDFFKTIAISVLDENRNHVELSDYSVFYTESKKAVDLNFNTNEAEGTYLIATDAMQDKLKCEGTSVTFQYSTDGKSYGSQTFLIGKDCCHIQWKDDKAQEIIIE